MPYALLLCGYWGSEPRSSYLCGSHHVSFPRCLPLQGLTLWFCLHKTLQSCLFKPLGTGVVTVRCHPGSRTLTPSLPCPRGCFSTVFQHGILNRRVQQQTGGHWLQLKGIRPCWAAVVNKKVIIIACIKSAQDSDLRRVLKTSWPLAAPHPTPNSLKPLQSPESGTLSALGPGSESWVVAVPGTPT